MGNYRNLVGCQLQKIGFCFSFVLQKQHHFGAPHLTLPQVGMAEVGEKRPLDPDPDDDDDDDDDGFGPMFLARKIGWEEANTSAGTDRFVAN